LRQREQGRIALDQRRNAGRRAVDGLMHGNPGR
jgi:hypothetical protein